MAAQGPAPAAGVYRRVLALLESPAPPSRNRHFARFAGEQGRLVLRLLRLYRALAAEAMRALARPGASARLLKEGGQTWLEVRDPGLSYQRRSLLPPQLQDHFRRQLGLG
ncbi:MAG: hypothetical protein AB1814_09940 [Thermodesulfobacteriota bacterium]